MDDYLRSNDYIIPKYQKVIDAFAEGLGIDVAEQKALRDLHVGQE